MTLFVSLALLAALALGGSSPNWLLFFLTSFSGYNVFLTCGGEMLPL